MGMIEVKDENIVIDIIEFLKDKDATGVSLAADVRRHLASKSGSVEELRSILADRTDSDFPRILKMAEINTAEPQELSASAPALIEKVDEFEQAMDDLANKFTALELYPVYLRERRLFKRRLGKFIELYNLSQSTLGNHEDNLSRLTELLTIF